MLFDFYVVFFLWKWPKESNCVSFTKSTLKSKTQNKSRIMNRIKTANRIWNVLKSWRKFTVAGHRVRNAWGFYWKAAGDEVNVEYCYPKDQLLLQATHLQQTLPWLTPVSLGLTSLHFMAVFFLYLLDRTMDNNPGIAQRPANESNQAVLSCWCSGSLIKP